MTEDRLNISAEQVSDLVAATFPKWAGLPVSPVQPMGWDNYMYRLGEAHVVRLPSAARYVPQVAKEQRWLPYLSAHLPWRVPCPVGLGAPAAGYPFPWSVFQWIEADRAVSLKDDVGLARDCAAFLRALWEVPTQEGPHPGPENFHRGGDVGLYEAEVLTSFDRLAARADQAQLREVWAAARASTWQGSPVWLHGDFTRANILVRGGQLAAVIDFGLAAVGDPAADLTFAWTGLSGAARRAFQDGVDMDERTWARARGWALWKAVRQMGFADQSKDDVAQRVLSAVLEEATR